MRHKNELPLQLLMDDKYPYKKAKLVHHKRDLSKRWYASCWVWDIELNQLVRKRYYGGINRYQTIGERMEAGKQLVDYINAKLEEGYVAGKDLSIVDPNDFRSLSIVEAFEHVILKKKDTVSDNTYKQYKTTIPRLQEWLKKKNQDKLKIGKLTKGMLHGFLDNLFASGTISSNKTYNNYLTTISTVLNYLITRDHKLFSRNPAADIKKLHTSTQKHAAYSEEQMAKIKKEINKQGDPQLLLFIQFIYYTLARPNEIKRMKISDIELENDQIFIPRGNSKNNKSDYVDLYPPLKRAILESKIMDYPKEYYIFSSLRTPGTKISYRKYFWRKHFKILEALKLSESNREYTLYSYKHSGAINLYLSGLEPIDIQKQCRHQTLQQTMDYLRDLDLFRKTDHFNKVKGF